MAGPGTDESQSARPLQGYGLRDCFVSGHKKRVTILAWSGNGRKLASGSLDQSIRIWAPEPHSQVAKPERAETTLSGHTSTITHLAWKPGQQHDVLLSITGGDKSDKSIRLWDVRAGKCSSVINGTGGNSYVSWCPDGSSFAVKGDNDAITFYDARKMRQFKQHKFQIEVDEIYWGPTVYQMMIATQKGSIDIVSLPSLDPLCSLRGHSSGVYCLTTNKMHRYVASGGSDALIALWDLADGTCVRTWAHMDFPVRSLSMSADGQYLAYATENRELEVLSTTTGERVQELRLRAPFCDCVAWSPTANVLAYTDEILDPTETRQRVVIGSVVIFAPPKAQAAAAG